MCKTRWAERDKALEHFYLAFPFLVDSLQVIIGMFQDRGVSQTVLQEGGSSAGLSSNHGQIDKSPVADEFEGCWDKDTRANALAHLKGKQCNKRLKKGFPLTSMNIQSGENDRLLILFSQF